MQKKIALLHRHPKDRIKETNAAFPYLQEKGIDILTYKKFNRLNKIEKFCKDLFWIIYAPFLVFGKGYDVIYCDDSFPFYPALVKMISPKSKVVLRIGDFHLMYYFKGFVYKLLHFFEKITWKIADEIIPISEPMQKYIGRGKVVLDPVDPKDFPIKGSRNHGTVMFHGYLNKNKNIDILIDAAYRLPNINFIIIGDGPDKERLENLSPINVFFKGWVPFKDISKYIETCAVGVALRSDNPGNEYVVTSPYLQYGIMGKPCLVTKRKVFLDYPWQFSNLNELVDLIQYAMTSKIDSNGLRKYFINNHGAQTIAEEIWQILTSV